MNRPDSAGAIRVIAALLEARTGQVLAESRMWRMETSLKPLLRAHGLGSLAEMASAIAGEKGARLAQEVVNALLNNETSFFRDHHVYQALASQLLPHLAQERPERRLRIWCVGCSTGQEPYSLAMLLRRDPHWHADGRASILASDISTAAIERARTGLFSQIDVQRGLGINDLLRWFEPEGEDWRISDDVRRLVDFRAENIFEGNAPTGEYDIILCRNLMIYFSPQRRAMLFERLARHCAPGGYLLLGAGETVIGQTADFTASGRFRGVYERIERRSAQGAARSAAS